jgi:predicted DNA-binding helix-hairpin-helix protein
METSKKLELLADASRFDLSCACGTKDQERRHRGADGLWLYPVSLPGGGTAIMLKTLMSNVCVNDCRYCPFRTDRDVPRCVLGPEETAKIFMDYVRRSRVVGLFLSSGVMRDPDYTMDRVIAAASILRKKHQYRGYIHLKIIPGASKAAVETAVALANAVSLNVEAPTRAAFAPLSRKKDYDRDIVALVKYISVLTAPGSLHAKVKQTTQFVVGASTEKDKEIIHAAYGLYRRLKLQRVYYSAYQHGHGDPQLPGEQNARHQAGGILTREHRLYQADFLLRKYDWALDEIPLEADGNLSPCADPKQRWADLHPERFPVRLRSAERRELLRVPGLGPTLVNRILKVRRESGLRDLKDVGLRGKNLEKAARYVAYE